MKRFNNFHPFNVFSLELEIWDAKQEDGDIINLYNNDKLILSNFEIVNKKKMPAPPPHLKACREHSPLPEAFST